VIEKGKKPANTEGQDPSFGRSRSYCLTQSRHQCHSMPQNQGKVKFIRLPTSHSCSPLHLVSVKSSWWTTCTNLIY